MIWFSCYFFSLLLHLCRVLRYWFFPFLGNLSHWTFPHQRHLWLLFLLTPGSPHVGGIRSWLDLITSRIISVNCVQFWHDTYRLTTLSLADSRQQTWQQVNLVPGIVNALSLNTRPPTSQSAWYWRSVVSSEMFTGATPVCQTPRTEYCYR